ncbi:membrane hypothetical protein [Azospirillaceae bacterium]
MYRVFVAVLVGLILLAPLDAGAQQRPDRLRVEQNSSQSPTPSPTPETERLMTTLILGAVGGVLLFNGITGGVEALPFVAEAMDVSSLWVGAMAINRVLTVATAGAGAWAAYQYIYKSEESGARHSNVSPARQVLPVSDEPI